MTKKLGKRIFYSDSYFLDNVIVKHITDLNKKNIAGKWENNMQYELYQEALNQLEFHRTDVDKLCFKAEHMSI